MRKLITLNGPIGINKSEITFRISEKLKHKTEIILGDRNNNIKEINYIYNKPLQEYEKHVKYNNLNEESLINLKPVNAPLFSYKTFNQLENIFNKGFIPIIDGCPGFYLNMIRSGGKNYWDEEKLEKYSECQKIARNLINYDKNFDVSLERLCKLDSTFKKESLLRNDHYRLERKMANAIYYGDGATETAKKLDDEVRLKNTVECDFYSFHLIMDKFELKFMLENSLIESIQKGLIFNIIDLIEKGMILPSLFYQNSFIRNIYGFNETVDFLISLDYLIKRGKIDKVNVYSKLENFVTCLYSSNQNHNRQQNKWFKSKKQQTLLMVILPHFSPEEVADQILDLFSKDFSEFKKMIDSENQLEIIENYYGYITSEYEFNAKSFVTRNFEIFKMKEVLDKIRDISFELAKFQIERKKFKINQNDKSVDLQLIQKYLN